MEPWFDEKEAKAVYQYFKSGGWITEFKKTKDLEKRISIFTKSKYCTMTTSGTVSLTLALLALGLKRDDEIIVPDLTMIATPNATVLLGVKPVLVDVEPQTLCIDLVKAQKAITQKTKALIYVPFNGRSGNMLEVVEFCKKNGLFLIEDAAQALGSYNQGKHLGTFGDLGTLSFSVPKIISTGQGGAILTNNKILYQRILSLKDFGRKKGGIDIHDEMGWNFKFTDIQAVIGLEQMKKLRFRIKKKKKIYQEYANGLKKLNRVELINTNLKDTCPWFIDIFVDNPDSLAAYLKTKGIESRRIYPAVHTQKIYKNIFGKKYTIAERYASKGLWLPSSCKLSGINISYIVRAITSYYN